MKLEAYLLPFREEILNSDCPIKAITDAAYQVINRKLHQHIRACKDEFNVDKITLLGGVIINTDYGLDDYFQVKNFELIDLKSLSSEHELSSQLDDKMVSV